MRWLARKHTSTPAVHATHADTRPSALGPGGQWGVMCLVCPWTATGTYDYDDSEPLALRLAHTEGTVHEHTFNRAHEHRGTDG